MKFKIVNIFYNIEQKIEVYVKFNHPETSTGGLTLYYNPYAIESREQLLEMVKNHLSKAVRERIAEDWKKRLERLKREREREADTKKIEQLNLKSLEGEYEIEV